MIIAESATPLDGIASAAAVLLILEASLIIILLAVIAVLFAFGLRWVHSHVVPLLETYVPKAKGALGATDRSLGVVVERLADLYGRRRGAERFVRVFLEALFPALFAEPTTTTPPHAEPAE